MEVAYFIYGHITVTVNKTLPRFQHVAKSKNAALWDDQLEWTWSCVDDRDMDWLLRKEENTRVFRLARRRMFERRGWMLKSRAFKSEIKQSQIGTAYSKSGFSFREKNTEKFAKSKKLKCDLFRVFFRSVFFSPNEKRVISLETLSWKRKIMLNTG